MEIWRQKTYMWLAPKDKDLCHHPEELIRVSIWFFQPPWPEEMAEKNLYTQENFRPIYQIFCVTLFVMVQFILHLLVSPLLANWLIINDITWKHWNKMREFPAVNELTFITTKIRPMIIMKHSRAKTSMTLIYTLVWGSTCCCPHSGLTWGRRHTDPCKALQTRPGSGALPPGCRPCCRPSEAPPPPPP